MNTPLREPTSFGERLAVLTLRHRWKVIAGTFAVVALALLGPVLRPVIFDASYRVFFSPENPQLQAFDSLQRVYTKDDNVMFVLTANRGTIYEAEFLRAVDWLTEQGWQIPFSRRVDSLTNFQHSVAEGDDIAVGDLAPAGASLDEGELAEIRRVGLQDPGLFNRLLNSEGQVTGVNVTVSFPDKNRMVEVPQVVSKARAIAAEFEEMYPDIGIRIAGVVMLDNAFSESAMRDMGTVLLPMFVAIFVIMAVMLRSVKATLASGAVLLLSIVGGMAMIGWYGYSLSTPLTSAPTMIMTLAVADCIHILVTYFHELRSGREKQAALVESLRVNFVPVLLTSVTTAVGFLSMNFSDSPPFRHLGNVVATGVMLAWAGSVFFLPAVISLLDFKPSRRGDAETRGFDGFVSFLARRRFALLGVSTAAVALSAVFIPRIDLNDQWVKYFDESLTFRQDADYMEERLTGMTNFEFSIAAAESGGINEPEYLKVLDRFAEWYRTQPDVKQVNSLADVMKRLNKNMHGDDEAYYRIPDSRELAAQYLLSFEFSLPKGLDLNNQINVDKSASRVTVTCRDIPTKELRGLIASGEQWLRENAPEYMHSLAVGPSVMFAHISERNIKSMLTGTVLAVLAISLILVFALRSVKYGVLSLVPNVVPAVLGFGIWSALYGEMGLSLAMVSGMTLGIVVDDTVHFLSKYLRARREKGLGGEEAVRYAFKTVGKALVSTTLILTIGFSILGLSSFRMNSWMGQLTAIVIFLALVADFILLPALLLVMDGRGKKPAGQRQGSASGATEFASALNN